MSASFEKSSNLSRRQAITAMASAAGGLALSVTLPTVTFGAVESPQARPMGLLQSPENIPPHELSAFLVIDPAREERLWRHVYGRQPGPAQLS